MFEGKTIFEIIGMGGFTMYILLACSVASMGIFIERSFYFWRNSANRDALMSHIRAEVEKAAYDVAIKICEMEGTPIANVVGAGLKKHGCEEKEISAAMEREMLVETENLERFVSIVGTIGNVAVYIGLFGTVLGIVNAFHNISATGSGGLPVVIAGVAEALICTATGLLVAVPSVVVYNYFIRRVDRFVIDMEFCRSETAELLVKRNTTE